MQFTFDVMDLHLFLFDGILLFMLMTAVMERSEMGCEPIPWSQETSGNLGAIGMDAVLLRVRQRI